MPSGPSPQGTSLLLWCCAGCIRGSDDCTEYYSLLGLAPAATPEELRRAWRKLSLERHPDKLAQRGKVCSAQDVEAFSRMKEAHDVLADPLRRRVYDTLGENGVKWSEDPSTINPQVRKRILVTTLG